jgi:hypothetical protein
MTVEAIRVRVYRFRDISGLGGAVTPTESLTKRKAVFLMANSDPMERGEVAAPQSSPNCTRATAAPGGDF